jgi:hypothetical protein
MLYSTYRFVSVLSSSGAAPATHAPLLGALHEHPATYGGRIQLKNMSMVNLACKQEDK